MIVRDGDVFRPADLDRQALLALSGFFLSLERMKVPVLHPIELQLGGYVMLQRHLAQMAGRLYHLKSTGKVQ